MPETEVSKAIDVFYDGDADEDVEKMTTRVRDYTTTKEPEWKAKYFEESELNQSIKNNSNFISDIKNYYLDNFANNKNVSLPRRIADLTFSWTPEYKTLTEAQKELNRKNSIGYDNYAHRLGMCRIGQMGADGSMLSPMGGLGLGVLKEVEDIYKKSIKGNTPWAVSLSDSYKDMKNNFEGLNYGLNNPDKNCRVWLEGLDYENNRWNK